MSKTSGAVQVKLTQWTRAGSVLGDWGPFESFESLVFTPRLQGQIQKLALGFLSAQELCANAKLPWRRGAFIFGPPGCGKSAVGRAIALLLGWQHLTIPAYEVADTHQLTRALFDIPRYSPAIVVLDNVDEIFKRIDPKDFFDIYDLAADRTTGIFWIATSRRPENVPKSQLVRPGRFEESIRLSSPTPEVKRKYYETYLEPFMSKLGDAKAEHLALLEANSELSFAHLQELRLLIAKVLMDGDPDKLISEIQAYCQEQVIDGDRWGGNSSQSAELDERVRMADPRLLHSGLQVVDAFKRVVEVTVTSASEALLAAASIGKEKQ